MIRFKYGSLLECKERMIVQQVNCQGVMGRGLALDISNKYKTVFPIYKDHCNKYKPDELMGTVLFIEEGDKIIANIFGQNYYGINSRFTNYNALIRGFTRILLRAKYDIAIPYGIGCNLAGGDWDKLFSVLKVLAIDFPHNIIIYNKENNKLSM